MAKLDLIDTVGKSVDADLSAFRTGGSSSGTFNPNAGKYPPRVPSTSGSNTFNPNAGRTEGSKSGGLTTGQNTGSRGDRVIKGIGNSNLQEIINERLNEITPGDFTPEGSGVVGGVSVGGNNLGVTTGDDEKVVIGDTDLVIGDGAVTGDGVDTTTPDVDNTFQETIDKLLAQFQAQNKANFDAEVAAIKGAEAMSLADQQTAIRQAEADFLANAESIDKQVFDAQQASKVGQERRGIASSQQGLGLEQGINRTGIGLRFKNEQDRQQRLGDIQDRIAAIKAKAQSDIAGAQARLSGADAGSQAQIAQSELDRFIQTEAREDEQQFTLDRDAQAYLDQVNLKEIDQDNLLSRIDKEFANTLLRDAQQNKYQIDRDFIQNAYAIDRLRLSHDNAKELMELTQKHDIYMDNYNFRQQKKIIEMENDDRDAWAELDHKRQIELIELKDEISDADFKERIKIERLFDSIDGFSPGGLGAQEIADEIYSTNEEFNEERIKTINGFQRTLGSGKDVLITEEMTQKQIRDAVKAAKQNVLDKLKSLGY